MELPIERQQNIVADPMGHPVVALSSWLKRREISSSSQKPQLGGLHVTLQRCQTVTRDRERRDSKVEEGGEEEDDWEVMY